MKKIAIGSDHAGFPLKEAVRKGLSDEYEMIDYGTDSEQSIDYPDYGFKVAKAVAKGECEVGILVCGSGIGMSIVANKVEGIRAALCQTKEFAELSRRHNNANVLVMPGRFIADSYAIEIARTWLNTGFEGDRHQKRIDKISRYENTK